MSQTLVSKTPLVFYMQHKGINVYKWTEVHTNEDNDPSSFTARYMYLASPLEVKSHDAAVSAVSFNLSQVWNQLPASVTEPIMKQVAFYDGDDDSVIKSVIQHGIDLKLIK